MTEHDILSQLVTMSNHLGDPALDYAILGEGNTSACAGDDTFWVKASGYSLGTITARGFVRVRLAEALDLLASDASSDDEIKAGLNRAKVDPGDTRRPSVETVLHALALDLAVIALFIAALFGFRALYYGQLWPNTYTLKLVGLPLSFRLANGVVGQVGEKTGIQRPR